jgi:hypothetical protein
MASPERRLPRGSARAIIDIGSNTVRLVIYGGPARAPTVLHNEKVTARLGKGVAENGLLGERASASALAALARYRVLLQLKGVDRVDVVATAAVRDAANGRAFLDKARTACWVRFPARQAWSAIWVAAVWNWSISMEIAVATACRCRWGRCAWANCVPQATGCLRRPWPRR